MNDFEYALELYDVSDTYVPEELKDKYITFINKGNCRNIFIHYKEIYDGVNCSASLVGAIEHIEQFNYEELLETCYNIIREIDNNIEVFVQ